MRDTQGKNRNHAEALRKQGIEVVELDVNSDASVDHGVHEVLKRAKRIDVLVNNAGVTFPFFGTYGASKFAPNPHDVADAIAKPVAQPWGQSPRASQTDGCLARRRTELAEGSIGVEAKRVAREETPSAPSASIAFLISGLLCKARLSIPIMSRKRRNEPHEALTLNPKTRLSNSVAHLGSRTSNRRTAWRLERAVPRSLGSPASRPLTQAFRGYVEQGNNENPEDGRSDHAAEHRRAHRLARDGPGAPRDNQGQ